MKGAIISRPHTDWITAGSNMSSKVLWALNSGEASLKAEVVVVPLLSYAQLFVTPWTVTRQACLSFTISQSLLKLMSIESIYKNEKKPSSGLYQDFCEPLFSFSSVHFSHSVMSDSLRPHGLQHTRLPCPSLSPRVCSNSCPLTQWWLDVFIQPLHPLSSPSPPAFNISQHQCLFQWVGFSHQEANILELRLQYQSFQWIFRVDFL